MKEKKVRNVKFDYERNIRVGNKKYRQKEQYLWSLEEQSSL